MAFITFEGPEGSGKSTQVELLATYLRAFGHDIVTTREPGGTSLGEQLRQILLNPSVPVCAASEAYLMTGARAEHVQTVIRPALAAGKIVLCDRFSDSTFAYQGGGRGIPIEALRRLQDLAVSGLSPDLTILLDLPVAVGLLRRRADGGVNRIDGEEIAFHERVADWYRAAAQEDPARWRLVDATESVAVVHTHIVDVVQQIISQSVFAYPRKAER